MNLQGIVEITDVKHEDCYVGYKEEIIKMLKQTLADELNINTFNIDFDYVEIAVDVIRDIEKHADNTRPMAVWNLLQYGMGWSYAEITLLD